MRPSSVTHTVQSTVCTACAFQCAQHYRFRVPTLSVGLRSALPSESVNRDNWNRGLSNVTRDAGVRILASPIGVLGSLGSDEVATPEHCQTPAPGRFQGVVFFSFAHLRREKRWGHAFYVVGNVQPMVTRCRAKRKPMLPRSRRKNVFP